MVHVTDSSAVTRPTKQLHVGLDVHKDTIEIAIARR